MVTTFLGVARAHFAFVVMMLFVTSSFMLYPRIIVVINERNGSGESLESAQGILSTLIFLRVILDVSVHSMLQPGNLNRASSSCRCS